MYIRDSFWSVTQVTAKADGVHRDLAPGQSLRYIRCDLLQRSGGQWGYKPLDESMHPYYYSCPVSYTHLRAHETVLDLVCRLLLEKKNKDITQYKHIRDNKSTMSYT